MQLLGMETTMNISATTFNFSAILVLAALAIAPQFSTPAQASVTSDLLNCRYNSRQQTVNCCEYILKTNQRPQWMQSGNGSCSSVVKCVGGKLGRAAIAVNLKSKCYVQIPNNDTQRSSTPREPNPNNPRQNRSFN
jgi:hypothetical protein